MMKTLHFFFLALTGLNAFLTHAQKRLTNREIYNFSVGDVIHIYDNYKGHIDYIKREFIQKLGSGNDSLIFLVKDSVYRLQAMKWYVTIELRRLGYGKLDSFPSPRLDTSYFDTCGTLLNKATFDIPDPIIFEGESFDETYYEGLGRYYYYVNDADGGPVSYYYLLYYKKAGVSCGHRIRFLALDPALVEQVAVYPNPAADMLHITGFSNGQYEIHDLSGRLLCAGEFDGGIPVDALSPGIYCLNIQAGGRYYQNKFAKE